MISVNEKELPSSDRYLVSKEREVINQKNLSVCHQILTLKYTYLIKNINYLQQHFIYQDLENVLYIEIQVSTIINQRKKQNVQQSKRKWSTRARGILILNLFPIDFLQGQLLDLENPKAIGEKEIPFYSFSFARTPVRYETNSAFNKVSTKGNLLTTRRERTMI